MTPPCDALHRRRRGERGSALFLFPVGLIIVMLLGAIVVDFANAHLARRELADAASAAANDAVTYGLDLDSVHRDGTYALDPARVRAAVDASLDRRGTTPELTSVNVSIDGTVVEVRLDRQVGLPFSGSMTVSATGRADALTSR